MSSRSRASPCARARSELLADVSFALERGEHVALVGPNGAGKTTLLETVLGGASRQAGTVRLGHGVEPAYFSQHEMELDERGTVLEARRPRPGCSGPQAQALLGRFLFSGWDDAREAGDVLSGGERRRLALALVVASGANFLVLDEPTNHLDLESREALEAALEAFPARCCSSRTTARCSTRSRSGRSRSRTARSRRTRAAGRMTCRRRAEPPHAAGARAEPEGRPAPKPERRGRRPERPSELERVEAEDRGREDGGVAELERQLAEDWTDVDTSPAHRRARDELQAMLARWEAALRRRRPRAKRSPSARSRRRPPRRP